jgi:RNA polymerase sigma factor (sigma-70 family)
VSGPLRMRMQDFERLYAEHAEGMFGFLSYRTGDRALAEDLLADVFERAMRARRRFDGRRGTEKAWLYTIAMNCLRDHMRRSSAEARAIERHAAKVIVGRRGSSSDLTGVDDRDLVMRALEELSVEERDVIALRFGADLSVADMARVTGERETTIQGRLYRALRKMRADLS